MNGMLEVRRFRDTGLRCAIGFLLWAVTLMGSAAQRPNVLMICIDDLNDWVGHLGGHPDAQTPQMDALAAQGRVFSNAHCSVPVCSASRISILSGLHATTHGSYELGPNYHSIERLRNVPTIHRYFKDHGYTTLSGGKVLHGSFQGFVADDIDQSIGGQSGGPRPARSFHWEPRVWDWGPYPESDSEMFDYQLARAAAEALQEDYGQPFFMSVGFSRPHVPLYVPPKWFDLFDRDALTLPRAPKEDLEDIPDNFKNMDQVAPTHDMILDAGLWRGLVHAYLASTSFTDHCVGTVLEGLRQSPHVGQTLVVLWSDHGFHLGEKRHWAKRTLWEESTRVPFILAGPGIEPGDHCREAVSLLDVYPTLLEMCGLPRNPLLEGISVVPQIEDPATPRPSPVIISSYQGNHAVRSRDWRYIRYHDGAEELYHHQIDPDEFSNLASDPAFGAVKSRLAEWIPRNAAPEVIPLEIRLEERERRKARFRQNRPVK